MNKLIVTLTIEEAQAASQPQVALEVKAPQPLDIENTAHMMARADTFAPTGEAISAILYADKDRQLNGHSPIHLHITQENKASTWIHFDTIEAFASTALAIHRLSGEPEVLRQLGVTMD